MAWQQLASGKSLTEVENHEHLLAEGSKGLLRIQTRIPIPDWMLSEVEEQLRGHGIPELSVIGNEHYVDVTFRKGFAWLAVIAAGLIVLAIFVIGWRLFKEVAQIVPAPVIATGAVAVVVLLMLIILSRRRQWA